MSADLVKQALAELGDIVRCRCHAAYTDRKLHDPDCNCDSAEALQIVSGRIKALQSQLAKARDALTLIEKLYYIEGKDAKWRASRMNGVAREAQDGNDLGHYWRIFPRDQRALDTPTPAPSPDALVKAAEMMVKAYREESDKVITAFYALEDALAAMKGGDT